MTLFSPEIDGEEDYELKTHCTHPNAPVGPNFCPRCCQITDQTLFFIAPQQIKRPPRPERASDGNCWGYNITCGLVTLVQGHLLFKPVHAPTEEGALSTQGRSEHAPIHLICSPRKRILGKGDLTQNGKGPNRRVLQRARTQTAVGNRLLSLSARSTQAAPRGLPAHEAPREDGKRAPGQKKAPAVASAKLSQFKLAPDRTEETSSGSRALTRLGSRISNCAGASPLLRWVTGGRRVAVGFSPIKGS